MRLLLCGGRLRHVRSGLVVAVATAAILCSHCARSSLADPNGGDGSDGGGAMDGSGDGSPSSSGSSGGGSSSSSGGSGSGSSSGASNECPSINDRSSDLKCTQSPGPTGNCNFYGTPQPGKCFVDSDCAGAGVNGRCIKDHLGPTSCVCTFDTCSGDSACGAGQTCACHTAAYTAGHGNTCVPSNCRVDSDCGPGGLCSPTQATSGCGGVGGYYCHTFRDECTTDCACTNVDPTKYCAFDTADGRWTCQTLPACQ